MIARSTTGLIFLVESLNRLGEKPAVALRRLGLDAACLDPTALLDSDLERRANEEIASSLVDPLAGLKMGSTLGIGSYGPFTLLVLTSENALAAFRLAIRFRALTLLFSELAFEPGRVRSRFCLRPAPLRGRAYRFRADLDIAGTWKMMRDVHRSTGVAVSPELIEMPYARPVEAAEYVATFGCPVEWSCREARFHFRNAHLHDRFSSADPVAHEVLRAQCERQLAERGTRHGGIVPRLRAHCEAFDGAMPTLADAALALGLSERSLRRQLVAAGTRYRAIVDGVRLERARELLLRRDMPVERVAERLGYSEPAAFIHAFKRWTGATPAAFRRVLGEGAVPRVHRRRVASEQDG